MLVYSRKLGCAYQNKNGSLKIRKNAKWIQNARKDAMVWLSGNTFIFTFDYILIFILIYFFFKDVDRKDGSIYMDVFLYVSSYTHALMDPFIFNQRDSSLEKVDSNPNPSSHSSSVPSSISNQLTLTPAETSSSLGNTASSTPSPKNLDSQIATNNQITTQTMLHDNPSKDDSNSFISSSSISSSENLTTNLELNHLLNLQRLFSEAFLWIFQALMWLLVKDVDSINDETILMVTFSFHKFLLHHFAGAINKNRSKQAKVQNNN